MVRVSLSSSVAVALFVLSRPTFLNSTAGDDLCDRVFGSGGLPVGYSLRVVNI